MSSTRQVLRICEWGRVSVAHLSTEEREAIAAASDRWMAENRLSEPPLQFTGSTGTTLVARQHVGVVSAGGATIEIYPKLDARLLDRDALDVEIDPSAVMHNLLWLLGVCGYMGLGETDAAELRGSSMSYLDLFAYVMAKNLRAELERGVCHAYEQRSDDLKTLRGRIDLPRQILRNQERYDRLACEWDEFTADIAMNRVLKCACRSLQASVRNAAPAQMLEDCCSLLAEVADASAPAALREAEGHRWSRVNDRFRRPYEMALQLLAGRGYQLRSGAEDTFVFLVDMNQVFEAYVAEVLHVVFEASVVTQANIGHLLTAPRNRIGQVPDYVWAVDGHRWVGDAKYKRLAAINAETSDLEASLTEETELPSAVAAQRLQPSDVRQVTVYAEILRHHGASPPTVAIFCPFVGEGPIPLAEGVAWNGSRFLLVPVRVDRPIELCDSVPREVLGERRGRRVA